MRDCCCLINFQMFSDSAANIGKKNLTYRLTALWAFNEAAFGGMLHALHIPLTGLFVGGFAAILISLILYYTDDKKDLLKASAIVIAVKFFISPHTPLNAYLSVFFQTFVATALYRGRKNFTLFAYFFGIVTLLFSAFQRVVVYTLLFGYTLWESVDEFYVFLIRELNISSGTLENLSLSEAIIVLYALLHLLGGIAVGYYISKLPRWLEENKNTFDSRIIDALKVRATAAKVTKRKKKPFIKRPSVIIILSLAVFLSVLTFVSPEKFRISGNDILLMLIRFFSLLTLWYFIAVPLLRKSIKRYSEETQSKYADELNRIFGEFGTIKSMIIVSWEFGKEKGFFGRVKFFLTSLFTLFLFHDA